MNTKPSMSRRSFQPGSQPVARSAKPVQRVALLPPPSQRQPPLPPLDPDEPIAANAVAESKEALAPEEAGTEHMVEVQSVSPAQTTAAPTTAPQTAAPQTTAPEPGAVSASDRALSPNEATALALSPAQMMAIDKMLSGHSVVASATAAGVTRMTIYNWLRHDPKFQAAYNAWRLDAITSAKSKLLAMAEDAVTTVGRAVKTDASIALAVLKGLGTLEPQEPGSTDHEEIGRHMEIQRMQKENRLEEEYLDAKYVHGTGEVGKSGGGKKMSDAQTQALIATFEKEFGSGS